MNMYRISHRKRLSPKLSTISFAAAFMGQHLEWWVLNTTEISISIRLQFRVSNSIAIQCLFARIVVALGHTFLRKWDTGCDSGSQDGYI